jgi:hypothetical protein
MWDLPATLMWLLGYEDMGAKQGRETLVQNAKLHCQGNYDYQVVYVSSRVSLNIASVILNSKE